METNNKVNNFEALSNFGKNTGGATSSQKPVIIQKLDKLNKLQLQFSNRAGHVRGLLNDDNYNDGVKCDVDELLRNLNTSIRKIDIIKDKLVNPDPEIGGQATDGDEDAVSDTDAAGADKKKPKKKKKPAKSAAKTSTAKSSNQSKPTKKSPSKKSKK